MHHTGINDTGGKLLSPASTTPVDIELRTSPRIFEKNQNGPYGSWVPLRTKQSVQPLLNVEYKDVLPFAPLLFSLKAAGSYISVQIIPVTLQGCGLYCTCRLHAWREGENLLEFLQG